MTPLALLEDAQLPQLFSNRSHRTTKKTRLMKPRPGSKPSRATPYDIPTCLTVITRGFFFNADQLAGGSIYLKDFYAHRKHYIQRRLTIYVLLLSHP